MQPDDWSEVAQLIHDGTNHWYQSNGKPPIFTQGSESTRLFCDVYEALDPGCCILAVDTDANRIAASCFYHPRETHVSLGIMNVHPDYFGAKLAGRLLKFITDFADGETKPVRLVSSAMNLDSFSLYTRAGFVPGQAYQDMYLAVPKNGLAVETPGRGTIRDANRNDIGAMVELEMQLNSISRAKDYRYFIENAAGIWHVSVLENAEGSLDGFLVSVKHDASNMLGPGVARTDADAAALIHRELDFHRGRQPVFLVPVDRRELVKTLYGWGARNCEIHFAQTRGEDRLLQGVVMPTFMPETG